MRPEIDVGAIRQTKWHEYIIRFVFGGCVTVLAGVMAREFGPVVGGLFLAVPTIFPASATLIEKHEKENRKARHPEKDVGKTSAGFDAEGAALGSVALVLFGWIVWRFLPGGSAAMVLSLAFVAWFLAATVLWNVRERSTKRGRSESGNNIA